MGDYDIASVVAGLAGLSEPQEPVPPQRLIDGFCEGSREERDGMTVHRGFCGYRGGQGASLVVGFDDGYDFLGYLKDHGWRALTGKGDWPLVVYMLWASKDEGLAIAEYCEASLTIWVFDSPEQAKRHYASLDDAP